MPNSAHVLGTRGKEPQTREFSNHAGGVAYVISAFICRLKLYITEAI